MEQQTEIRKSKDVKKEPTCETSLLKSNQTNEQIALNHISDVKQDFPSLEKNIIATESKEVFKTRANCDGVLTKCDYKVKLSDCTDEVKSKSCNECDVAFDTKIALKNHLKKHNRIASKPKGRCKKRDIDATFTCRVCRKSYTRKYHMEKHLKKIHPNENFISSGSRLRSEILDFIKINKRPLDTENDTHKSYSKKPKLDLKSEYFEEEIKLEQYNNDLEELQVTANENGIDSSAELKNEELETVKEELTLVYHCPLCPKTYELVVKLNAHLVEEHDVDKQDLPKPKRKHNKIDQALVNQAKILIDGKVYYSCKDCGKSLHSPYTYVWHMRIHTGERPFVCDLCGRQFRVSQGLTRHLKDTHEKIKTFPCDLCGRMFGTRRYVEEHRRIHTNERPYVCALCGKSFKQKASLFVHNRTHNKSFPFKCTYCPQVFRTKSAMLFHMTRHTGEKPYSCDVCGRAFRINYELKRHKLVHSETKPYSCEICGAKFRQRRYLSYHNKTNHKPEEAILGI